MAGAATALETHNVPYNLAIFDINVDQAPTAARRCLELVRNSHVDLQDLIRLRASSLHLLTGAHPAALQRVDAIIQIASNSLVEVCQLVEKLRPETENGKTTLMGRLGWKLVDSRKFKSLEPHILQQQNSVLAELSYLRQLILMRQPPMEGSNAGGGDAAERAMADEILSGRHLEIIPRSPTDWDKVYVVGDTRQEANKIRIERRPVTAQVPMMGGARTVASAQRPAVVWDNIGLLDEMFGGGTSVNPPSAMSTAAVNDQAPLSKQVKLYAFGFLPVLERIQAEPLESEYQHGRA
ncbi:hypothetical protein B0T19DRAFT_402299 [Cercophora scortea]|uniref:Uncharacterized protein n=1 Tax=Cercophora scortea TaxID=314031 RepID=A0AAE0IFZ3_9PEZI|nr:hypothetical protein B0T19DRAFT_402299 [Cercophora scortea]